jgi:UDP:flavonoid glycosyltransferase YjiC (YdhE family)
MRIAIAAEGTRGDIYPMLALAERLTAAGHFVRVCAPPDFAAAAAHTGAEFVALGVDVRRFMSESAAALHSGGLAIARRIRVWGKQSLASQFQVLPEAAAGMDVLFAAGTILAAASAAELHGIPYRFVAYVPSLLPSGEHAPALLPFQPRGPVARRALWWCARALIAVALRPDLNRARRALGLAPVRDALAHVLSPHPVLAVDRPLAPAPSDCATPVAQIPCLHPRGGAPLPEKLEHFLASGPAPVFLGFGSMTDPDPAATTRRLLEAIDALGCRALISHGWAGLAETALPGHVMAVGDVSHARLFPRVAAVVHHGGAGTTHSAARAGVPQILVPHLLDQYYFARRIHELGVGPPALPRKQLTAQRLAGVLRAALDNEHLAHRAGELARQLAALPDVEEHFDALLGAGNPR